MSGTICIAENSQSALLFSISKHCVLVQKLKSFIFFKTVKLFDVMSVEHIQSMFILNFKKNHTVLSQLFFCFNNIQYLLHSHGFFFVIFIV